MTLQELEEKIYEAGILGLNRLAVGSDLTLDELQKHLLRKPYLNQQIVNRSVSDATDGYHIRSGKDYGELASGNLPLGGIPAALAGIAYQQATGIKDSSLLGGDGGIFGTIGPNALLQSADNIEGLRQSGKAPALDALYNFGGGVHNLFNNPSSIDVTALGGPRAKGNIFNQGRIDVNKRDAFTGKQLADSLAMDAQLAYNQVPNYPTGPGTVISAGDTEPTITPPPPKAAPVMPTYNPPQGPAGFTRPTRSPAQQAAQVDRKAKSMGVASPIRRTPGTKYGFGL